MKVLTRLAHADGVQIEVKVSAKLKEAQRPKAIHDVKGSLLIDKVAERESINATNDEVDHEVQRIAKQEREPVAATRKKLQKDGILGRIAYRIRSEKTLNFLFEHARKEAATADNQEETVKEEAKED